jgi:RNA polymerase sigma-70 factor, ECF subfamily
LYGSLEETIKKAQKGNDKAFFKLIDDYKALFYKTAYSYVGNKEDALEIVNDTVYKAYKDLKKLEEPKYFKTWITRILINCCNDYLRKKKKNISLNDKISCNNDNTKLSIEEKLDLHSAVNNLDSKYRNILVLKYFHGMTLKEVSEILKCPLGTVKTNLHKALEYMRNELKEEKI